MAQAGINVGSFDARARQVAGALAIVGGLTALDGFFQALGFLTWIVCAAMMYVGIVYAMGGFKDGTAQFGYPLLILSVLDAWLPLVHKGYWGLIAGVVVAIGAFQTARHACVPDQRAPGSEHRRRVVRLGRIASNGGQPAVILPRSGARFRPVHRPCYDATHEIDRPGWNPGPRCGRGGHGARPGLSSIHVVARAGDQSLS